MALLEITHLSTQYLTRYGVVRAVEDANLPLGKSQTLGIIGESGCGKTTLALSVLRLIKPPGRIVAGQISLDGVDLLKLSEDQMRAVRWKRISLVFQGAQNALNPVRRVGEQIIEAIKKHRESKESLAREIMLRSLDAVNLTGFEDCFPHQLSGGMKQRAVIAMALSCDPDIIILDEPTTALDALTQYEILRLLRELQRRLGLSAIVISHDLSVVAYLSHKLAVMYAGRILEYGDAPTLLRLPRHPYTSGLIRSFPRIRGTLKTIEGIPGSPPNLLEKIQGCPFAPRCRYAIDVCRSKEVNLTKLNDTQYSACLLAEDLPPLL